MLQGFIFFYAQIHFHGICFCSRKRDIKFAADIMCKSVFVTRPQVPEKPHLFLPLSDPTEIVLKLHHMSRRNTAQNNRSRGSFVGLMTAHAGFM